MSSGPLEPDPGLRDGLAHGAAAGQDPAECPEAKTLGSWFLGAEAETEVVKTGFQGDQQGTVMAVVWVQSRLAGDRQGGFEDVAGAVQHNAVEAGFRHPHPHPGGVSRTHTRALTT